MEGGSFDLTPSQRQGEIATKTIHQQFLPKASRCFLTTCASQEGVFLAEPEARPFGARELTGVSKTHPPGHEGR